MPLPKLITGSGPHRRLSQPKITTSAAISLFATFHKVMKVAGNETPPEAHTIRRFNCESDLQDLNDICENVYGGTDYMPRIIHRIASDAGVLVLAAEALSVDGEASAVEDGIGSGPLPWEQESLAVALSEQSERQPMQPATGRVDGVICGERRGDTVFLYGLRVREGTRGRGLGHLLMTAICQLAPEELAAAPDASPPPPLQYSSPAAGLQLQRSPQQPQTQPEAQSQEQQQQQSEPSGHCSSHAATTPEPPPPAPQPISHIITCTTSYNPAAQRIIGRQLLGPALELEIWPGHAALGDYEAAVGWVRGQGVRQGAPNLLDWLPGARAALDSDVAARSLLPRWRRVSSDAELRGAVQHLLYGSTAAASSSGDGEAFARGCESKGSGQGVGTGGGWELETSGSGSGAATMTTVSLVTAAAAAGAAAVQGLLWLPMPYNVWPVDSAFVRRELAAGNVWLVARPAGQVGAAACTEVEEGCGVEEVVGIMLLTYYETFHHVCAGILALDNSVTHAAIAHAGSLHPHFLASTLRNPSGCRPPVLARSTRTGGVVSIECNAAGGAAVEPSPALYEVTGGYCDYWVYGKPLVQHGRL